MATIIARRWGARKTWTRRLWTDEEKRSICLQTAAPGVSVAQVARRYSVNANLIFKWLRDPKYRPEALAEAPGSRFLPVEIVAEAKAPLAVPMAVAGAAANHIEIELAGGHRMRISGTYDPEALARLIRGLSA
jgi:transposase